PVRDVDDAIGVPGRLLEPVEILEAAATHRRAERGQGRRGCARRGTAGDVVPGGDELGDDVGTGMAGPPSDENVHVTVLSKLGSRGGGVGVRLVPRGDWRRVARGSAMRGALS